MNNCSQLDEIIVPYPSISISRYILSLSLSLFMHKYSEVWSLQCPKSHGKEI